MGPADPFVICTQAGEALFRTKVIDDATDPVWNHKETLTIDPDKGDLTFIVMDDDSKDEMEKILKSKDDDFIGKVEAVPVKTISQDFPLKPPPTQKEKSKTGKKKVTGEASILIKMVVEAPKGK